MRPIHSASSTSLHPSDGLLAEAESRRTMPRDEARTALHYHLRGTQRGPSLVLPCHLALPHRRRHRSPARVLAVVPLLREDQLQGRHTEGLLPPVADV